MSSWPGSSSKRNSPRPEQLMLKHMLGVPSSNRSLSSRRTAIQAQGRGRSQDRGAMLTSKSNSTDLRKVSLEPCNRPITQSSAFSGQEDVQYHLHKGQGKAQRIRTAPEVSLGHLGAIPHSSTHPLAHSSSLMAVPMASINSITKATDLLVHRRWGIHQRGQALTQS
jgi:hypothetical protein